ncbi:MAG: PEP-CTERM sorting domain-containing protein [Phycisphaerae bacterium]|nr:PEP-CTERM sorting domain-containing protein [Phycisphaerae bacterium]
MRLASVFAAAAVFVSAGRAHGQCSFLDPQDARYGEVSLNGGIHTADGGFDVLSDGRIVAQVSKDVNLYASDGTFIRTLTSWDHSGWGSFVRVDPTETTVWFGYTGNGAMGHIRTIPLSADNGSYTDVARFDGNLDLEFSGGVAYVAGLNAPLDGAEAFHGIWRLDTSGSNAHDCLVNIGGSATGCAFDNEGRLLAGTYDSAHVAKQGLAGFDWPTWSAMIDADPTVSDSWITLSESDMLTLVDGGLRDVTVDEADNVLFNENGFDVGTSHVCLIEHGKDYSGYGDYQHDILGTGNGDWGNWLTCMDAGGDVLAGGRGYTGDFFSMAIGYVSIPEPATLALMGLSGFMLIRRRR